MPGGFQLFAQGLEVVNFAVEHDDEAAVLVEHRLAAALQVDDGQAAVAERDAVVDKIALAVRAAVGDEVGHLLHNGARLARLVVLFSKAGNATHSFSSGGQSVRPLLP